MDYKLIKVYLYALLSSLKSSLISMFAVIIAFLAHAGDLLLFVAFLIVIDFITGVLAAKSRGQLTESKKMAHSITKTYLYFLVMVAGYMFDQSISVIFKTHFFDNLLSLFLEQEKIEIVTKFSFFAGISFIIVVREFKSIDENWNAIFKWSFIDSAYKITERIKSAFSFLKNLKK